MKIALALIRGLVSKELQPAWQAPERGREKGRTAVVAPRWDASAAGSRKACLVRMSGYVTTTPIPCHLKPKELLPKILKQSLIHKTISTDKRK